MHSSITDNDIRTALDAEYSVPDGAIESFERDGFVRLPSVLAPDVVAALEPGLTRAVLERNGNPVPMEARTTYQRAFVQVTHLWRNNEEASRFVHSKRLAKLAADLLGVPSVRLFHEQALYKEPAGGFTPWHADQYYWPLDTDRVVTVWVPLQDTPSDMGPLEFAPGSHRLELGRDLAISDESEQAVADGLAVAGIETDSRPYALGDVSFHLGWTFHRAGPNVTDVPRRVMTVVYVDAAARFTEPTNHQRQRMIESVPGAVAGGAMPDALPVLYP